MEPIKGKAKELAQAIDVIMRLCEECGQRRLLSICVAPDTGYASACVYGDGNAEYRIYRTNGDWMEEVKIYGED